MDEAKWTPMVVVRANEDPAVIAMECRANRGTNDSALYLEKTSIRGGQSGKRCFGETCSESVKRARDAKLL